MLNCRDVAERLDALQESDDAVLDIASLETHLTGCAACRALASNLQSTRELLQRTTPPAAVADDAMLRRIESAVFDRLDSQAKNPTRPRLHLIQGSGGREEEGGSDEVEAIFDEIRTAMGSVSNMFRAYARHPAILSATWERVKSVMLQGTLPSTLKEAIAVVISHDNHCNYCVEHHSRNLASLGMDRAEIARLLADPLAGNFTPKERALLVLARQANGDPHGASVETLNLARRTGANDLEIIEALAVMELFTSLNRFLNTLDIPLEAAAG
ncbi:peroxidase-related enzyme [Chromatocurvus halotolerans]|uniref:Putative peroxidase-related enzyme n=1 Tax=Chromatocurvus halotolerans TaxID=1132028 RepID=A0A4R2KVJ4_9GAMM|nr:peroxidase-related enzyme [Chromatocurvus halotolerans]TCO77843.1 putative peroxidase-related enzyme [Chromatocurvus halotolerans]